MRSFIEQYGLAMVVSIAILLLIAIVSPVGNMLKNDMMAVSDKSAQATNKEVAEVNRKSTYAMLEQIDKDGNFKVTIFCEDVNADFDVYFRYKEPTGNFDQDNNDFGYKKVLAHTGEKERSQKFKLNDSSIFGSTFQDGYVAQVKVVLGENEYLTNELTFLAE